MAGVVDDMVGKKVTGVVDNTVNGRVVVTNVAVTGTEDTVSDGETEAGETALLDSDGTSTPERVSFSFSN